MGNNPLKNVSSRMTITANADRQLNASSSSQSSIASTAADSKTVNTGSAMSTVESGPKSTTTDGAVSQSNNTVKMVNGTPNPFQQHVRFASDAKKPDFAAMVADALGPRFVEQVEYLILAPSGNAILNDCPEVMFEGDGQPSLLQYSSVQAGKQYLFFADADSLHGGQIDLVDLLNFFPNVRAIGASRMKDRLVCNVIDFNDWRFTNFRSFWIMEWAMQHTPDSSYERLFIHVRQPANSDKPLPIKVISSLLGAGAAYDKLAPRCHVNDMKVREQRVKEMTKEKSLIVLHQIFQNTELQELCRACVIPGDCQKASSFLDDLKLCRNLEFTSLAHCQIDAKTIDWSKLKWLALNFCTNADGKKFTAPPGVLMLELCGCGGVRELDLTKSAPFLQGLSVSGQKSDLRVLMAGKYPYLFTLQFPHDWGREFGVTMGSLPTSLPKLVMSSDDRVVPRNVCKALKKLI